MIEAVSEPGVAGPSPSTREERFDWPVCYEAEKFILTELEGFLDHHPFARTLAERMRAETGTLLLDWVDYLVFPRHRGDQLTDIGYTRDPFGEAPGNQRAFAHPEAMLPRVLIEASPVGDKFPAVVAVRTESVSDFMAVHGITGEPEGEPLSRFRRILVSAEREARLEAVERRGYRGYLPKNPASGQVEALLKAQEVWKTRSRASNDDEKSYALLQATLDRVISLAGRDLACHVVFIEERAFWERRNRAGQIQKARQDKLGLGWANHDHHTFRSSRKHFVDLMVALEKLGFERRERYYAGAQAGWGAQILEQPIEGIVAFCDVDLDPEETQIDFSRRPLPPSRKLGTIGLWVGLHGESLLEGGMHHLECRFDHEMLRAQLANLNVNTMKPFSDFPFLKQAFTEGEKWPVRPARAERLLRDGLIDDKQFHQFVSEGAIGSHLENLQRKGGFKGFNQKSVSAIIQATDPRGSESA